MSQHAINRYSTQALRLVIDNAHPQKSLATFAINYPEIAIVPQRYKALSQHMALIISGLIHLIIAFLISQQMLDFSSKGKQEVNTISVSLMVAPKKAELQPKPTPAPKPVVKTQKPVPIDNSVKSPIAPIEKAQSEQKPLEENPAKAEQAAPTAGPTKVEDKAEAEPVYVAPKFGAEYLQNPAPEYPSLSRRRGEQGKVMLRVNVSAKGAAEVVAIEKTSGFDALDKAAIEAVKGWKFVPASSNNRAVSGVVIVPIRFSLDK